MNLFAERNTRIDTENAFKVGPHIVRVEKNINPGAIKISPLPTSGLERKSLMPWLNIYVVTIKNEDSVIESTKAEKVILKISSF